MERLGGSVSTDPGLSLRERQKDVTRSELRTAALRLFEHQGYTATSIDDISRAAGVSRSTFFRYLGSKEAVVWGEYDENASVFLGILRQRPVDESPMQALEETLISYAEVLRSDERREEMLLVNQIMRSDAALQASQAVRSLRWREEVADTLAARAGRTEPTLEDALASAVLSQLVEYAVVEWRSWDDTQPVSALIRSQFATLRNLVNA